MLTVRDVVLSAIILFIFIMLFMSFSLELRNYTSMRGLFLIFIFCHTIA